MKIPAKQQNLYLQCRYHGLPANKICSLKACRNKLLACVKCKKTNHEGHPLASLSAFLQDYQTNTKDRDQQKHQILCLIREKHRQAEAQLNNLQQQFNEIIQQASCRVNNIFNCLANDVLYLQQLGKQFNVSLTPQQIRKQRDYSNLQKSLGVILDHCKMDNKTDRLIKLDDIFSNNRSKIKTQIDFLTSCIGNVSQTIIQNLHSLDNLPRKMYKIERNSKMATIKKMQKQKIQLSTTTNTPINKQQLSPLRNEVFKRGMNLVGNFV